LVGANGAGKSTLVRILAGLARPDSGQVLIDGVEKAIGTPQAATKLGLSFIHQELNLVPKFTAVQNMAMNYEGHRRFGLVSWRKVNARAKVVMQSLGSDFPLDREVDQLTVSQKWMVSLGRSLMRDARLIAMDEPTASFAAEEAERLFAIVRDLTARGVAVLYISHKLDEVLDLSTDITVLRDGALVGTLQASTSNRRNLAHAIVGREVEELSRHEAPAELVKDMVLRIEDLAREPRVKGVTIDVHRGEILGLAGLVGAGRTEVARLVFGAERPAAGAMMLDGKPFIPKGPYEAIARGVALVPEERRSQGLLLKESLAFNVNLATAKRNRASRRLPFLSPSKARAVANEMMERFSIKARSVNDPVAGLSGGNQQKVVIAKWLFRNTRIFLFDEPTRGIDVGAKAEVFEVMDSLARSGAAVLMVSSEMPELLQVADRILVMRQGRLTGELPKWTTQEEIMRRATLTIQSEENPT